MNIDMSIDDDVTIQDGRADTRSAHSRVLAEVDHFEIRKPLGAGGFGTVYLARDTTSDIDVALKVVGKDRKTAFCSFGWDDAATPRGAEGSKGLENELRENFKLIHGLTHPNIAVSYPLHLVRDVKRLGDGVSISRGDILSVMAYAPGVTLDKWRMMFEGGRVPVRLAGDIVMQIASALDYAHANGVIHRDVKPSNIMVDTREGCKPVVRLLDFGLAATTDGGRGMCGTPQYMSPEQWGGEHQDRRTDQYALAVLACELLTGHVPLESVFKCDDREVMRIAVMNRELEFPQGLSSKQRQIIAKAMTRSPEGRFKSCEEFAVTLARRKPPFPRIKILIALVLVLGGAALFVVLKEKDKRVAPEHSMSKREIPDAMPGPSIPDPEPSPAPEPNPIPSPEPKPVPTPPPEPPSQKPEPVPESVPVPKPDPVPASAPKPTLPAAIQEKLRQTNQEYADLKGRYRDPASYKDVEGMRQRITDLLKDGEYEQVGKLSGEYSEMIRKKHVSLSGQVATSVSNAKALLAALDWNGFAKSCDEALSIEPRNQEALGLRQKVNKGFILGKADSFAHEARGTKEKKKKLAAWVKCKNAAEAVLELDPGNREAKRLRDQADNGLGTVDIPRVATPRDTLRGTQGANGVEPFNQEAPKDEWRHQKKGFFD